MNLEKCQCPLKWRCKLGGLEILKPDCMCANMSPVDATRSNQLGMSMWFCPLPWYGTFLTPYGNSSKESTCILVACKNFEKFYASFINCLSSLVAHVLTCFYNKCEPCLYCNPCHIYVQTCIFGLGDIYIGSTLWMTYNDLHDMMIA